MPRLPFMHVLGHPNLPLEPLHYPEDAQIRTCWSFCQLLEFLGIGYCYYGLHGSRLPGPHGQLADCGHLRGASAWQYGNSWHRIYNQRLSRHLRRRCLLDGEPELVASLYGASQQDIRLPEALPVLEPMLGYNHCWTAFRVFPSYAQQHTIYATCSGQTQDSRGHDVVIPHFLLPEEYPFQPRAGGYLLYLGREAADKGLQLARQCAADSGLPLKMLHRGVAGSQKARLLGEALAVLTPTLYTEPFGYVAIEAQMCGTPVLATDWGAFTETVEQGVSGFRCRTREQFRDAAALCRGLNRQRIRDRALQLYSLTAVAPAYRRYFDFVWQTWQRERAGAAPAIDDFLDR